MAEGTVEGPALSIMLRTAAAFLCDVARRGIFEEGGHGLRVAQRSWGRVGDVCRGAFLRAQGSRDLRWRSSCGISWRTFSADQWGSKKQKQGAEISDEK